MFNISELLKRIKNVQSQGLWQRKIIKDALKKHADLEVSTDDIVLKSFVIYVKNISQTAKNIIFIKKQQILEEINSFQKNLIANDIK